MRQQETARRGEIPLVGDVLRVDLEGHFRATELGVVRKAGVIQRVAWCERLVQWVPVVWGFFRVLRAALH